MYISRWHVITRRDIFSLKKNVKHYSYVSKDQYINDNHPTVWNIHEDGLISNYNSTHSEFTFKEKNIYIGLDINGRDTYIVVKSIYVMDSNSAINQIINSKNFFLSKNQLVNAGNVVEKIVGKKIINKNNETKKQMLNNINRLKD